MDLNPKDVKCAICGQTNAWIFVYQDILCSECFKKYSELERKKERKENQIILEELKKDHGIVNL